MLWTDRAGKSSGISPRPIDWTEIVSYLTQHPRHPTAYFLSPLHMDERQFGIAALSFGKLPCCYQPEYCTWISYLCLALEQLAEKESSVSRMRTTTRSRRIPGFTGSFFRSGKKCGSIRNRTGMCRSFANAHMSAEATCKECISAISGKVFLRSSLTSGCKKP